MASLVKIIVQLYTTYRLTAMIDLFVQSSAVNLVSALWQLMEGGLEELRILQTIILLITTSNIVHGECLGKVSRFFVFPLKRIRLLLAWYLIFIYLIYWHIHVHFKIKGMFIIYGLEGVSVFYTATCTLLIFVWPPCKTKINLMALQKWWAMLLWSPPLP